MKDKTVYLVELDGVLLSRVHDTPEETVAGIHTLFESRPDAKEANIIVAKLHDTKTTYRNNRIVTNENQKTWE